MKNEIFDELCQLWKTDQRQWEQRRQQIIDDFIDSAPTRLQHKLRQTQWVLDTELSLCKTPVDRYNKIVERFWDQVAKFNEILNDYEQATKKNTTKTKTS